jgi:hypothetical protein
VPHKGRPSIIVLLFYFIVNQCTDFFLKISCKCFQAVLGAIFSGNKAGSSSKYSQAQRQPYLAFRAGMRDFVRVCPHRRASVPLAIIVPSSACVYDHHAPVGGNTNRDGGLRPNATACVARRSDAEWQDGRQKHARGAVKCDVVRVCARI